MILTPAQRRSRIWFDSHRPSTNIYLIETDERGGRMSVASCFFYNPIRSSFTACIGFLVV
uniref:Uncharacterized protein n=1 Tax=Romanomermis culicivorax TaxID=13658 RepID=A0A915IKB7_ROMCU